MLTHPSAPTRGCSKRHLAPCSGDLGRLGASKLHPSSPTVNTEEGWARPETRVPSPQEARCSEVTRGWDSCQTA